MGQELDTHEWWSLDGVKNAISVFCGLYGEVAFGCQQLNDAVTAQPEIKQKKGWKKKDEMKEWNKERNEGRKKK